MKQSEEQISGVEAQEREPISAFVVCYNEEDQIRECLDSLHFCDEIVVIDSFSTDRTVEIAKECGAIVIQREWQGYRDQKSFGLSRAKYEWVINLDADERVSEELQKNIIAVLKREWRLKQVPPQEEINGYYINRIVYYLGRWWRRGGWYPEYRLRLLRKSKTVWSGVEPHEKAVVSGRTGRLKGELYHYTYKDMNEQLSRLHNYSSVVAQEAFKEGKQVGFVSLICNPLLRFLRFYFIKRGYREGYAGLIVAIIEGYYTFLKYAKLWELNFCAALKQAEEKDK